MIFVDSSFWIALHLPRDRSHDLALSLLRDAAQRPLLTSNHVRGETWTFLRRHTWQELSLSFLDRLERTPRVRVAHVAEDVETEAMAWLRQHDERPYSFVDATSFALMRKLGLKDAFAFDGDFTAAGFVELR